MSLEIQGRLVKVMPQVKGEGKNGGWVKQDFVIETAGDYPKKVCLTAWGDKVANLARVKPGDVVKVSFEPSSREYNERWFTELRAWKIDGSSSAGASSPANEMPPPPNEEPFGLNEENGGDLPF
ncbi:MAG TPA: hypothetical protein DCQ31_01570 [Bacteroidales bacterium]|nr:hypothetical protein [Bacteroidales bacterium]